MKDDQLTDSILVERFQKGNSDAMDALIRRHQARAYHFAFGLTHDRELAADVVAEAFVRMYRSTGYFKGQSSFATWMFRIITNCFLDMRKKSIRRPTVSLEFALLGKEARTERPPTFAETDPHQVVESSERNRSIRKRLRKLPEYQQVMILLFHGEMLSYDEIAETLDVPVGTVKSRLNRARISLRTALDPEQSLFVQDYAQTA